jgi:hypothetical protein
LYANPSHVYLEGPIVFVFNRLDRPSELVPKRLGEELFDRNIELLGEDDSETRIDIIL